MKLTSTFVLSAFTAVALAGVPACDDSKKDDGKESKDKKKDDKKKDEKKADAKDDKKEEAKEEAKEDEGGGGGDKIGVPECDEYITKYMKCIDDKMPDAAKEQTKKAVEQSISAWKQAADGPGKDALAQTCKTALETAKKATEAMGCEW